MARLSLPNNSYSAHRLSKEKAQVYGDFLEQLKRQHGTITPDLLIKVARNRNCVLHGFFQWDDAKAAAGFRVEQAKWLIRSMLVEIDPGKVTRAFINVDMSHDEDFAESTGNYMPIRDVLVDTNLRKQLLETAYDEMRFFRHKYANLQELVRVHAVIDDTIGIKK